MEVTLLGLLSSSKSSSMTEERGSNQIYLYASFSVSFSATSTFNVCRLSSCVFGSSLAFTALMLLLEGMLAETFNYYEKQYCLNNCNLPIYLLLPIIAIDYWSCLRTLPPRYWMSQPGLYIFITPSSLTQALPSFSQATNRNTLTLSQLTLATSRSPSFLRRKLLTDSWNWPSPRIVGQGRVTCASQQSSKGESKGSNKYSKRPTGPLKDLLLKMVFPKLNLRKKSALDSVATVSESTSINCQSILSMLCDMKEAVCLPYYYCSEGKCVHEGIFPPDWSILAGLAIICLLSGASSVGGLGGGGVTMPFITLLLHYSPKETTLLVFVVVLAAQTGNVFSQFRTNRDVIKTQLVKLVMPFTLASSLVSVLLNIWLPAIFIVLFLIFSSTYQLPILYRKALSQLRREQSGSVAEAPLLQSSSSGFDPQHFWKAGLLALIVLVLLGFKGSIAFPSWVGIPFCSVYYWLFFILMVGCLILWGIWQLSHSDLLIDNKKGLIPYFGTLSGAYAGFGLGGGMFLNRLYMQLGLQPLQSSSTTCLSIFFTSAINVAQVLLVGAVRLNEFVPLFIVVCFGGYLVSRAVTEYLRKVGRYSYLQFLLCSMVALSIVTIPYGALKKWQLADYDNSVLFSFKNPC